MYIKASHIFTGQELLENHVLEIKRDLITDIFPEEKLSPAHQTEVLDLGSTLILPGFINAHCHLELTAVGPVSKESLQAQNPEDLFVKWIQALVTQKNSLDVNQKRRGIQLGIKKLIQSGVTTIGDHVSFNTDFHSILESPLKGRLFFEVVGVLPEVSQDIYRFLKERFSKNQPEQDFYSHIVPHSVHALYPQTLKEIFDKESSPLSCHLAESLAEKNYFENQSGEMMKLIRSIGIEPPHKAKSGYQYLNQEKVDLEKLLIIHGNDLSSAELDDISQKKISIVHCPHSHHYFEHDDFPLQEILDKKINLALGTDSISSNTDLNFLEELQTFRKNHPQLSEIEILQMATLNGAKALQLDDMIGSISIGKRSDFIGFKLDPSCQNPLEVPFLKDKIDFGFINGNKII